jgi:glycosyltransferase involved in cell wall biosynthesis
LKVLHICHSDNIGGAPIATMRIADSLNSIGINNNVLVRIMRTESELVIRMNHLLCARIINSLRARLGSFIISLFEVNSKVANSINILPSGIINIINKINPDIVHIHWIGHEMLSIESIAKIKVPIIWTLHDMWLFSGTEHCPPQDNNVPGSFSNNKKLFFSKDNIDQWTWKRKKKLVQQKIIYPVAPSRWMAERGKGSQLLKDYHIDIVPNPLDIDFWHGGEKQTAKSKLNLPIDKKILLFGLYGDVNVRHKGFDFLVDAIGKIKTSKGSILLSIFGGTFHEDNIHGVPLISHGFVDNEFTMRDLYQAADVYIVPSRMESFGQTAAEAMACRTPVVAFTGTGLSDFVIHKKTGWLAPAFDTSDLARGIDFILGCSKEEKRQLGIQSQKSINNLCAYDKVSHQYKGIYEKAISLDKECN